MPKPIPTAEPLSHSQAWDLLPWLSNGTLEGDTLDQLLEHLKSCRACREELRFLPELRLAAETTLDDPNHGLMSKPPKPLLQRIEAYEQLEENPQQDKGTSSWLDKLFGSGWAPRLAVAQALLLVALVGVWRFSPETTPAPSFRTLSQAEVSQAKAVEPDTQLLRIVFLKNTPEEQFRALVLANKTKIVGGPSAIGAYTLEMQKSDEATLAQTLELMRGSPWVKFVEPILTRGD